MRSLHHCETIDSHPQQRLWKPSASLSSLLSFISFLPVDMVSAFTLPCFLWQCAPSCHRSHSIPESVKQYAYINLFLSKVIISSAWYCKSKVTSTCSKQSDGVEKFPLTLVCVNRLQDYRALQSSSFGMCLGIVLL